MAWRCLVETLSVAVRLTCPPPPSLSREVTDHQRLSGAGYCFSASAPPFTCAVATQALKSLSPELLTQLADNAAHMHKLVASIPGLEVISDDASPIVQAQLEGASAGDAGTGEEQEARLRLRGA